VPVPPVTPFAGVKPLLPTISIGGCVVCAKLDPLTAAALGLWIVEADKTAKQTRSTMRTMILNPGLLILKTGP